MNQFYRIKEGNRQACSLLPRTLCFLSVGVIFLSAALCGCAKHSRPVHYAAPSLLPHITPAMKTAGYWISLHPAPDRIILNPEEIKTLNKTIKHKMKLSWDLALWPVQYSGEQLKKDLKGQLEGLKKSRLMLLDGTEVPEDFWAAALEKMNLPAVPEKINRQYGLVLQYADQRVLPTADGLYAKAFDVDFDELQNSALDIGEPVVILHTSFDGQWVFVQSALSSGWLRAKDVSAVSRDDFERMSSTSFVVVIESKADVYTNSRLTKHKGYLRMGTRLPFVKESDGITEVLIPDKGPDGTAVLIPGYIMTHQLNQGFLLYTPRMMIVQAFKMLDQPYGWGDMYGEQDCSRFLQEVFATVGIKMPRNSSAQIRIGQRLDEWPENATEADKISLLKESGLGGATVLGMKGHIMLYLGVVDDRAYAIHAVWAYRQPGVRSDDVYVLNKVTVSDLTLGEGSKRGSLLKRLNSVRLVGERR